MQKHPNVTSSVPFLYLDDKKRMKLFPLLLIHKEAPDPDRPVQSAVPCASSEIEFPVKKWVHVGCEVLVCTRLDPMIHTLPDLPHFVSSTVVITFDRSL